MVKEQENRGRSDANIRPRENLGSSGIEIRSADLEKDSISIARIFSQPRTIEHLSGVAPAQTRKDIRKFRENIQNLMPDANIDIPIIIAVKEDIEAHYRSNPRSELLVAVEAGKVIGTITLEKGGTGIVWIQVSKFAVSEEARGKGIGTKLLQFANSRMFNELGARGAYGGIIRGVENDGVPLHLFEKEGYVGVSTSRDICVGWSNREDQFVYRSSLRVQREIPRGPVPVSPERPA